MRDRKQALRHAWQQLEPGGRLVMLDAKTLSGRLGRLLYPLALWTLKLTVPRQSGHRRVERSE